MARRRLVAERAGWEGEKTALRDEIEEVRAAGVAARERATSAHDALEGALAVHRAALDERDFLAARAAAAHEQEAIRMAEQLDQSRTAFQPPRPGPKLLTTEPPAPRKSPARRRSMPQRRGHLSNCAKVANKSSTNTC